MKIKLLYRSGLDEGDLLGIIYSTGKNATIINSKECIIGILDGNADDFKKIEDVGYDIEEIK